MKIFIIVLVVILVLGAAAFFIFFGSSTELPQTPISTPSLPEPATIPKPAPTSETQPVSELEPVPEPQPISEPGLAPESPPVPVTQPREPQEFIVDIYSFTDWRSATLTIRAGDTVTFINHDDELHWPGSDPHPTHSSLPQFDALGGLSEGQSYSYTFRKLGVYGHHEHLLDDPPTLGAITVLP